MNVFMELSVKKTSWSGFVSAKFLKRSASDLVTKFAENMEDQHKELQRMQAILLREQGAQVCGCSPKIHWTWIDFRRLSE